MLNWAFVFLLAAVVTGVMGFGGFAAAFAGFAQVLFFVALLLLAVSLVAHLVGEPDRRRTE